MVKNDFEYQESSSDSLSITLYRDYTANVYVHNGYKDGSVSMNYEDFKNMVTELNEILVKTESEILNKEWEESELRSFLSQTHYFRTSEEFELTCIEEGFEETEYGTFKKVY